ncbi:uncharacterized protein PGTG_10827 [Puccinia graminis f. sp. tritici CRL 75-36-700-3]|uniref:Uncharacterized protein n=1 Tax=Puccinia graminis f. sp. tritici (strain CRL 75-36-700-3 / race SCCL) TaxID=418459 RepID=E3KK43_PUCGT|nr:uncharacterized protein PGTG_10827 [Puccinia graminis f. sp. tritici CRL 75-36-700-3]EFP84668.1 hypothetical protein PGTG_10827 [Puccinia graminis f. sp. tritici CRL 75-36-700-3]
MHILTESAHDQKWELVLQTFRDTQRDTNLVTVSVQYCLTTSSRSINR